MSSAACSLIAATTCGCAWPVEVDRDAGREVEEEVAVDVLDRQALAADRHDRVGARQARRGPFLVERDVRAGLRAGQLRDDVRDGTIAGETRRGRDKGHLWTVVVTADCIASMQTGYSRGV